MFFGPNVEREEPYVNLVWLSTAYASIIDPRRMIRRLLPANRHRTGPRQGPGRNEFLKPISQFVPVRVEIVVHRQQ